MIKVGNYIKVTRAHLRRKDSLDNTIFRINVGEIGIVKHVYNNLPAVPSDMYEVEFNNPEIGKVYIGEAYIKDITDEVRDGKIDDLLDTLVISAG